MSKTRKHVAIVDLGYGDAGKGSAVDWLCSQGGFAHVVRYNGGAQAAHNVVLEDGRHHTFAQFGSGTLRDVPTILSRYMIFDPLACLNEAVHLRVLGIDDPLSMLYVHLDALVITPYHVIVNRCRETARGLVRHGSCGMGIGETVFYSKSYSYEYVLRVEDLDNKLAVQRKVEILERWARVEVDLLEAARQGFQPDFSFGIEWPDATAIARELHEVGSLLQTISSARMHRMLDSGPCVFEGAQGVLLDEDFGFHPYTTWSRTTLRNIINIGASLSDVVKLGVLRTYMTRHGEGPLVSQDVTLGIPEPHNVTGEWQGDFRVGHFDAVAYRYARNVVESQGAQLDGLFLTHVDTADTYSNRLQICYAYDVNGHLVQDLPLAHGGDQMAHQVLLTSALMGAKPCLERVTSGDAWITTIEKEMERDVVAMSAGPTAADKSPVRSDNLFRDYGLGTIVSA